MNRSYFKWIVLAAALCVVIVSVFMYNERLKKAIPTPLQIFPRHYSPFASYISAVGIVEASTGNIFIGSPLNRVVDKVEVKVGQKVKENDVLFRLESDDLQADLNARTFDYQNAQADLKKLESLPRSEDLMAARAQMIAARAELQQTEEAYRRVQNLNSGAMSKEEVARRRFAFEAAEAKAKETQANLAKIKAGAWEPDVEIARLKVKQAEAQMQRVQAEVDRTIVRAPKDATVLQVQIHEGEFPPADPAQKPAMIIGNVDTMNLRVNINQFDALYFNPKEEAVAYAQGHPETPFPLYFVNVEPYLVSKQNLTNAVTEKVDTRVLQVNYCFEEGEQRVFVGQQMDVYIRTLERQ